ncbi:MAG: hypothetical protein DRO11_02190 [Methanobacteriota archaeon]|nr:MAG: hypothetical protein DRO11_02190 [Euryarchaeota archaeon]
MTEEEHQPEQEEIESVEIDWAQAEAKLKERQSEQVTRTYGLGDDTHITFVLRALTPEESECVEALASKDVREAAEREALKEVRGKRGGRRKNEVDFTKEPDTEEGKVSLSDMKDEMLIYGIVRGPKGWTKTKESIHALPPAIRTDMVDTIDTLSKLDVETEAGFRPTW